MIEFTIPDMSCGHCVGAITKAVQSLDAAAVLRIDLPNKRVEIDSSLPAAQVAACLVEAGYPANQA